MGIRTRRKGEKTYPNLYNGKYKASNGKKVKGKGRRERINIVQKWALLRVGVNKIKRKGWRGGEKQ